MCERFLVEEICVYLRKKFLKNHQNDCYTLVPPRQTNFTILNVVPGDGTALVNWKELPDTSEYLVSYIQQGTTAQKSIKCAGGSFIVTGLVNGATYVFNVLSIPNTGLAQRTQPFIVNLPRRSGLQPHQLGLLINDNDPDSIALGEYYRVKRNIPTENILHLKVPKVIQLNPKEFESIKNEIDSQLPDTVQAIAVAWTIPSRVSCNSLTSALAMGYMNYPCAHGTCLWANTSLYFNTSSNAPFRDYQMRPAMMLAAANLDQAKLLVDRGVSSDSTNPFGTAYIMNTTDSTRSLRARIFPSYNLGNALSSNINVQIVKANSISATKDALFYFQGLASVGEIDQNKYQPGAVGDHLTSYGGMLTDSSQMSALNFISGGLTGTFGTVSEPCAYAEKFPNPSIMISRYTQGETLIEAYWKSVRQTFQGVFVGEPLANPWKRVLITY